METLPRRQDVDVNLTWDLSAIYKTEEEMFIDLEKGRKIAEEIIEEFKGKIKDASDVNKCVDLYQEAAKIFYNCSNYVSLWSAGDHLDSALARREAKVMMIVSDEDSKLSFVKSEISELDEEIIKKAMEESNDNYCFLRNILRNKKHKLTSEAEMVISSLSNAIQTPYIIYNSAKLADMKFDNFEVDGKSYPLGYSLFEDDYQYHEDTKVRRKAFEEFSKKIKEYENVTAAAYNACVQNEKVLSKLRGFDSIFDYLLFDQEVSREMYDRQIDIITKKLAPHMRKYAKLLQRVHKLDKMTFADLKLPLDPEFSPKVTVSEAKDYIKKGLSILGEETTDMVERAFKERWVDFAQNQGKETGGFCAGPYGVHAYILLSWNNRMSDVMTLAHELGHANHFRLSSENNSLFNTEISGYYGEAPSTGNELIMANYLLNSSDDKRFKRWVYSSIVGNTYYHNFVTHLLEAAYQREVYKIVDMGGSVDAPTLSEIKRKVLEDFWGDAVKINEGAELTWMRQPHYYMGLYSYTYSAGLTIGTIASERIVNEGQSAVDDWLEALKGGAKLSPLEFAKKVGADISTEKPLKDTIEKIGKMIDEMIILTDELEGE